MPLSEALAAVLNLQPQFSAKMTGAMEKRGVLIRDVVLAIRRHLLPELRRVIADLEIEGKNGSGNPARVPWVRLFSPKHSSNPQVGHYLVFLFSSDGSAVFLSLLEGVLGPDEDNRPMVPVNERDLNESARKSRRRLQKMAPVDELMEKIILHDRGRLGKAYEAANIYAIKYAKGEIPNDERIASDLRRMLGLLELVYPESTGGSSGETNGNGGQSSGRLLFDHRQSNRSS